MSQLNLQPLGNHIQVVRGTGENLNRLNINFRPTVAGLLLARDNNLFSFSGDTASVDVQRATLLNLLLGAGTELSAPLSAGGQAINRPLLRGALQGVSYSGMTTPVSGVQPLTASSERHVVVRTNSDFSHTLSTGFTPGVLETFVIEVINADGVGQSYSLLPTAGGGVTVNWVTLHPRLRDLQSEHSLRVVAWTINGGAVWNAATVAYGNTLAHSMAPGLAGGWLSAEGFVPRYRWTPTGMILLSGALTGGNFNSVAFVLPVGGYRPTVERSFLVPSVTPTGALVMGLIDILPSGEVIPRTGHSHLIYLDSINYSLQ